MKDYGDLKTGVQKEYIGVPLYLKKLLEYFNQNRLEIFSKSLPSREDIVKNEGALPCIVLECISPHYKMPEEEEETQLVVVACPSIEKIFHFKAKLEGDHYMLNNASISDFFYHPCLPRIKILSRNFGIGDGDSKLSDLKFLYTPPKDANLLNHSLKIFDSKFSFDHLVPDPAVGVQIGNLSNYYISSIKIIDIKESTENLNQVILVCEDWETNKFNFYITASLFRNKFKSRPTKEFLKEEHHIRALVFQEFCEEFKHILELDIINKEDFLLDSFFSFVRFRKRAKKNSIPNIPQELPDGIYEEKGIYVYLPEGITPEAINTRKEYPITKKPPLPTIFIQLRKLDHYLDFHPDFEDCYLKGDNYLNIYKSIEIEEHSVVGLHKSLLRNPIDRLKFFTLNIKQIIFCPHCRKYQEVLRTEAIPEKCPICEAKILVRLKDWDDKRLFEIKNLNKEQERKFNYYDRLSSLFLKFNKYLYYTLNATGRGLKPCIEILNAIYSKRVDENEFFRKVYKILKKSKEQDIISALYEVKKNEV